MKLFKNIFTLVVGLLFEGGATFFFVFLFLGLIALILGTASIFLVPFLGLLGLLVVLNLIFNKNIYK